MTATVLQCQAAYEFGRLKPDMEKALRNAVRRPAGWRCGRLTPAVRNQLIGRGLINTDYRLTVVGVAVRDLLSPPADTDQPKGDIR